MFWFYLLEQGYNKMEVAFKYILCFGSTWFITNGLYTSSQFKYILCFGSTARFPMPRLYNCLFKYILCFGSTNFPIKYIT